MSKPFKTFDEQIELLISMDLHIDDRDKLKWYLQSYNYQNIINGYNDFFMVNNDRKNNKYKKESSSNGIIELFNFDRTISKCILSSIQNIERMISTALAYTIAQILNENGISNGKLFSIDKENIMIKKIFSFKKNINWYEKVLECFENSFTKNNDKNKIIYIKYNDFKDIPIWSIVLNSTFGNILFLLKSLKKNIFFNVMKNSSLKNWNKLNMGEIITVLGILKDIRNRICHNNVLYNISISDQSKRTVIKKIINNNDCFHQSKIKLYEVIKVIEKLDPNAKKYLSNLITNKIKKFKNIDKKIINIIRENVWNKN